MGWGIWGSRTSIFPSPPLSLYTSLPIFHALPRCILQGSPYRHTSPVSRGEPPFPPPFRPPPPPTLSSSCPLLKLTLHSFVLRPFLVRWAASFSVCRSRRIVARAFSFFVVPGGESRREGIRGRENTARRFRGATSRRTTEESSHETSIAEENTNLILRVIHLGRHRSGLSPVICIFTSICFVLIVCAPARLCTLLQRRK